MRAMPFVSGHPVHAEAVKRRPSHDLTPKIMYILMEVSFCARNSSAIRRDHVKSQERNFSQGTTYP